MTRFNEELYRILEQYAEKEIELSYDGGGGMTDEYRVQAKDRIRSLILEEIIGEDDAETESFLGDTWEVKGVGRLKIRNELRAEQRKKLEDSHGTK